MVELTLGVVLIVTLTWLLYSLSAVAAGRKAQPRTLAVRSCIKCAGVYGVGEWTGRDAHPDSTLGIHREPGADYNWTVSHGICNDCDRAAEMQEVA